MKIKGIIAVRSRGANIPSTQIESAFEKLGAPGSIVDSDANVLNGVEFIQLHGTGFNWKKISLLVSVLLIIGIGLLVYQPAHAQQYGTNAAAINFASSGNNTVISATSAKALRVSWLWLCVAGATNITIVEVRPGTNSGAVPMTANGCMTLPSVPQNGFPLAITSVGNAFIINSSNAVQVSGAVYYDITNI